MSKIVIYFEDAWYNFNVLLATSGLYHSLLYLWLSFLIRSGLLIKLKIKCLYKVDALIERSPLIWICDGVVCGYSLIQLCNWMLLKLRFALSLHVFALLSKISAIRISLFDFFLILDVTVSYFSVLEQSLFCYELLIR